MKVYELMSKLADLPASADVRCINADDDEIYGDAFAVIFDGTKADDDFVQISFNPALE